MGERGFILFFTLILIVIGGPVAIFATEQHKHRSKRPSMPLLRSLLNNFGTVERGKLYRSKQPSAKQLDYYLKKYHIKTIINLRGAHPNKKWWIEEKEVARQNKALLCNIHMKAQRLPRKEEIAQLLSLYDHAPRPILIHCQGGSDRTGTAAALWVIDQQGKSKKNALKQLSLRYRYITSLCPTQRLFIRSWNGRDWLKQIPQDIPVNN